MVYIEGETLDFLYAEISLFLSMSQGHSLHIRVCLKFYEVPHFIYKEWAYVYGESSEVF